MSQRLLAFAAVLGCALPVPALADLQVPLEVSPAAEAVAKRSAAKKAGPAAPRPQFASRSLPRQIGVARRGAPPILPRADGTIVPDLAPAFPTPIPPPTPAPEPVTVNARLGKMIAPQTDVYRMPDVRSAWVGRLKADTQVAIVSQWQGWYAVVMGDGSQAYIPQTHVEVQPYQVKTVIKAAPAPPPAPLAPPAPVVQQASFTTGGSTLGQAVLREAYGYLGTPYVWGGNTRAGLDCSGLVKNCFAAQGIQLPRRGGEQAQIGEDVPLDQLQPGDRLYFSVKRTNDHTGIYVGDGKFIHAGRGRGDVGIDRLSQRLYKNSLTSARR